MDAVSLKLARNYTNEKLNSLPSNRPTKTVSFDGGIYSVGNDVVNGQVSDVVLKGLTATNIIENGNFADGTTGWHTGYSTLSASSKILTVIGNGGLASALARQSLDIAFNTGKSVFMRIRVRVTNSSCNSIRLRIAGTDVGTLTLVTQNSPVENQWYLLYGKVANDGSVSGNIRTEIWQDYADDATATDKVMEVQEVFAIDMTAEGLEDLTADEMNAKFPHWFDGTKSTISASRLKSVNKNLVEEESFTTNFTKEWELVRDSKLYEVDSTKPIYINFNVEGSHRPIIKLYDANKNLITLSPVDILSVESMRLYDGVNLSYGGIRAGYTTNGNKNSANNVIIPILPNKGIKYVQLGLDSGNNGTTRTVTQNRRMISQVATAYEPHYNSTQYLLNVGELRSLPNGVKDEVNLTTGVKTQNVSEDTLVSDTVYDSLDTSTYTNVDVIKTTAFSLAKAGTTGADGQTHYYNKDGVELMEVAQADIDLEASVGKYYWGEDKKLYIIVAKGDYADIAAARTGLDVTSLNYQLATPIVTKLPAQAPLQVFENGTVYVEPIGDVSESTLPTVELTIPTGTSNKFGVATHDYDGAAADWVLTNNESKCFLLAVSNAGGSANIIAPNRPGTMYAISNASGYAITIKKSGGTGVEVTNAKTVLVIHDGTDYTALTAEL